MAAPHRPAEEHPLPAGANRSPQPLSGSLETDAVLAQVYDELRRLAGRHMSRESPTMTIQATALVHEAYLKLVASGAGAWRNRAHFFGAAARAMRQILVDRARRRRAVKHGGGMQRVNLDVLELSMDGGTIEHLPELDHALSKLEAIDPRKARIVMLRYFAGLTIDETAEVMDLSSTVIKDEWKFARAWLFAEMTGDE